MALIGCYGEAAAIRRCGQGGAAPPGQGFDHADLIAAAAKC